MLTVRFAFVSATGRYRNFDCWEEDRENMLVQKRSRMEAGVRFLGGGNWWKGWREEDGPGMQDHDYRLSGPRTVNMKTVRGKELCSLLLDSQVKISGRPKDPWFWT